MGLGFSFGVKDAGLAEQQVLYAKGFETMAEKMAKVGEAASSVSMGEVTDSSQTDQMNKSTEAVDKLSHALGTELPENSKKGTEQFHQDAQLIESDERKIGGGFNFIRDAVGKLNTIARQNKLQTFIQAISMS